MKTLLPVAIAALILTLAAATAEPKCPGCGGNGVSLNGTTFQGTSALGTTSMSIGSAVLVGVELPR